MRALTLHQIDEHAHSLCGAEFIWGKQDCHTIAFNMLKLITGVDLLHLVDGKYDSEETARKHASRSGTFVQNGQGILSKCINKSDAKIGDFLISNSGKEYEQIHINLGGSVLASSPEHGIRIYPMKLYRKFHPDFEVVRANV